MPAMAEALVLRRLEAVLTDAADVRFALLFGSRALGTAHAASDFDVVLMPNGDWPLARELELQAALERAAGAPVDLVRLDKAPLLVAWEAMRDGVKLCGSDGEIATFRARIALEHADAAPLLAWAARRYAELIAEQGTAERGTGA